MKKSAQPYSSQPIGPKVLIALVLAIIFLLAAIYITRYTFSEVNDSIARLSISNDKNNRLNEIYSAYGQFERGYQAPLIADPNAPTEDYLFKLDSLNGLIDNTRSQIPLQLHELIVLDSIQAMIISQNERLMQYRSFKSMEQPSLQRNLDSLINLISSEELLRQSDIVTTRKSTRVISPNPEDFEEEKSEKKSFFQRLFSGGKEKSADADESESKKPEIIEETYIRIDTVPLAKSDTSKAKAGVIIKEIKRDQASQKRRVSEIEMEIVQTSARIQNFILSLIRNVEEVELNRIKGESKAAEVRMQTALRQMYIILAAFSILATLLVFRIMTDLTRAKFYRLQLVSEKERAENLSKIKERFLANISHEIRTPLQNILGYSEKLLSDNDDNDIKIIHQSSEHLLQIINQVLDFSRISTGKLSLTPRVVHLKELFKEVVSSMNIQAARKDIRILFESEIHHSKIYIDPFRLRQILYNLLGNAVKFTEEGFIRLFAKTEDQNDGVHLFFSIEDTGVGMTQEEINSIFQEFEQVGSPEHTASGTGLGLSITKALVEAHKGNIAVESELGQGSIFTIDIVLDPIPDTDTEKEEQIKMPKVNSVLVVDDDEVILNLTQGILTNLGIEVTAVSSPFDAIDRAKENRYDMALVDYRMPGMSGAEVCTQLKNMWPDMPVVAVTANNFNPENEEDKFHSFDYYLPKPYKSSELIAIVGHAAEADDENTFTPLMEKLDEITFGDKKLAQELIDQFRSDCLKDIELIHDSVQEENHEETHRIAHMLAGRLSFFEFDELASGYKAIEKEIHSNHVLTPTATTKLMEINEGLKKALVEI